MVGGVSWMDGGVLDGWVSPVRVVDSLGSRWRMVSRSVTRWVQDSVSLTGDLPWCVNGGGLVGYVLNLVILSTPSWSITYRWSTCSPCCVLVFMLLTILVFGLALTRGTGLVRGLTAGVLVSSPVG